MAFFIESEVREKANQVLSTESMSVDSIILESNQKFESEDKEYDIFLSHSKIDEKLVLGIKSNLEEMGYSVYIDWIEDKQLDRSQVTKNTAQTLKNRMNKSKSLIFVTTENSVRSIWMPWELGYFDGYKGKVAILPIKKSDTDTEYKGQEYLGIYPYVTKNILDKLYINSKKEINLDTVSFKDYINDTEKIDLKDWLHN